MNINMSCFGWLVLVGWVFFLKCWVVWTQIHKQN